MAMTIKKRKDTQQQHVIMHRIADIRGGVSLKTSELPADMDFLPEGTIVSAPDTEGFVHLCDGSYLVEGTQNVEKYIENDYDTKTIKIPNRDRHIVDVVSVIDGGGREMLDFTPPEKMPPSVNIHDVAGDLVISASSPELFARGTLIRIVLKVKANPPCFAVIGTGKPVVKGQNIDTDAWTHAVTKGLKKKFNYTDEQIAELKGVVNYE